MLLERAAKRESVRELFAVASERLRRLISFQAAAWVATDPHTGVPAGQAWLENIRADDHTRVWEFEFLRADINTYRDLVTAEIPAAGLRLATSERPARSARYREILRPNGFEDGLRAVVRADGSLWASIALLRTAGMPAFDAGEIELVASLSEPLADVVREHVRESAPSSAPIDGHRAGLMVFAAGGEPDVGQRRGTRAARRAGAHRAQPRPGTPMRASPPSGWCACARACDRRGARARPGAC